MNGPPRAFKYIRLSFSVNRFNRFNSGRICRNCRRLILTRNFAAVLPPFILSKRARTACHRGEKARANTIQFVGFQFQIYQQVTVRFFSRVSERFHHELALAHVHLPGQDRHLTDVARVLEQNQLMGVQIHGSNVFV